MTVASRVRRIYERRPYPPPSARAGSWTLPAIQWVDALREERTAFAPRRILAAGCGVGTEAFMFAKQFPAAEVIAVDFSARSIATAKKLAKRTEGGDRVRFEVADLASAKLFNITGSGFDFVSCHGVLSYIPDTGAVLRNFARCLAPGGVVMLGLNGVFHPSNRWRKVLPRFGIDIGEFKDQPAVREILRICDSLSFYPPIPIADRDAGYLAGDIFGPLNRALPLAEWDTFFRGAGLHLMGSYQSFYTTRSLVNGGLHAALMPRTRGDVSLLVDVLQPASFHQLILSRRAPARTPWMDAKRLLSLRPILTPLYTVRWPRGGGPPHNLRTVSVESKPTNTKVELRVPQWEVDILRGSDGKRSLGELLEPVRPAVRPQSLREAMYLLYLLGIVNLRRGKK